MRAEKSSPRIVKLSWGQVQIEGRQKPYKDAKLYPGGAREWDWNETGTRHVPGIQTADIEELLEHGARVVVLSKGFHERLQVTPDALRMLEERDVRVHVLQSEQAVQRYNALRESQPVGALIHSTC